MSAFWGFLSAGIAFLVGVIFLELSSEIADGFLIFFYCATVMGFTGAIVCVVAYVSSRHSRKRDISIAIQYMEDVESIYNSGSRDN